MTFGWQLPGEVIRGPFKTLALALADATQHRAAGALVGEYTWQRKPPVGEAKVSNVITWALVPETEVKP